LAFVFNAGAMARRRNPEPQAKDLFEPKTISKILVARDGIEPPTPAFSGLRSTN
jgi:hypothetical protein